MYQIKRPAPPAHHQSGSTTSLRARGDLITNSILTYSELPLLPNRESRPTNQESTKSPQPPTFQLSEQSRSVVRRVTSYLLGAMAPSVQTTPRVSMTQISSASTETTPIEQTIRFPNRSPRQSLSKALTGLSMAESVGSSNTVVVPAQIRRMYSIFPPDQEHVFLDKIQQIANTAYSIDIEKGFIWFTRKETDHSVRKIDVKGVKFHVSLSHVEAQFTKGVLIVLDELLKLKHHHFKIVQPSFLSKDIYDEAGREVIIYAYMIPNIIENGQFCLSVSTLLKNISERLFRAGVGPYIDGADRIIPPIKDTMIVGLQGITWRNDKGGYLTTSLPNQPIVSLRQDTVEHESVQCSFIPS
ncbi:MAG: hypothetical protein NTW08_08030 [Gammaproteobacteria bacterium]|nr:hypothetical protein [Gammaproteobacteria bacterium]